MDTAPSTRRERKSLSQRLYRERQKQAAEAGDLDAIRWRDGEAKRLRSLALTKKRSQASRQKEKERKKSKRPQQPVPDPPVLQPAAQLPEQPQVQLLMQVQPLAQASNVAALPAEAAAMQPQAQLLVLEQMLAMSAAASAAQPQAQPLMLEQPLLQQSAPTPVQDRLQSQVPAQQLGAATVPVVIAVEAAAAEAQSLVLDPLSQLPLQVQAQLLEEPANMVSAQLVSANSRAERTELQALKEAHKREMAEEMAKVQTAAVAAARQASGEIQRVRGEADSALKKLQDECERLREIAELAHKALERSQDECKRLQVAAEVQVQQLVLEQPVLQRVAQQPVQPQVQLLTQAQPPAQASDVAALAAAPAAVQPQAQSLVLEQQLAMSAAAAAAHPQAQQLVLEQPLLQQPAQPPVQPRGRKKKARARDQLAAPAATGTSSGQQQQKEAGSQKEAGAKPPKKKPPRVEVASQVAAAAPAATGTCPPVRHCPPASTSKRQTAQDQSAAPAATGTSPGQQPQKEAGAGQNKKPRQGATKKSATQARPVLSVPFEESMERISVTGDGSCGFWCWLACFGLCKHAVVRTLQEDKKIKQKLEEAQEKASRAAIRGAPPTKEPTIKGKLEPPMSDYKLLKQLVTHMQQDDDTWDRLRDKAVGAFIDAARQVQATSSSCQNVDSSSYMDSSVHLPYLAVKLGMPVFCVGEVKPGTENFAHAMFDANGEVKYLGTEAAMLAEMNGFQPTPLFQFPPLFKLVGNHWSLHLPQGTSKSDTHLKAKESMFHELFALSAS